MRPIRILLVDDDPADVLLTRRAMSQTRLRLDMSVVPDGEAALEYLNQAGDYSDAVRPDLVILDLNIPKRDGIEVLKMIKSNSTLCSIPVIVLTTSGEPQDVKRAYANQANSYVRKPIDLDSFTRVIQDISHFWFTVVRLVSSESSSEA